MGTEWNTIIIGAATGLGVALLGLLGVIITAVTSRTSERDKARISILDASIEKLSQRVTALETALAVSEAKRDAITEKFHTEEKMRWLAVNYSRMLLDWGRELLGLLPEGVDAPLEPMPPAELEDDV